jgi:hypothetical protein
VDRVEPWQWFRYLVGVLELAGAIRLVIPVLAGLAALGLTALFIGATYTQLFVLDAPAYSLTPARRQGAGGPPAGVRPADHGPVVHCGRPALHRAVGAGGSGAWALPGQVAGAEHGDLEYALPCRDWQRCHPDDVKL